MDKIVIEPDWSKILTMIETQVKSLREEIPHDISETRNVNDVEMFDLKISAMQSRIKKALKELQYASFLSKDILNHVKEIKIENEG